MATTIIDKGSSVEFNVDGKIKSIPKSMLHMNFNDSGDSLTISDTINPRDDADNFSINYINVTTPTVGSGSDLYTARRNCKW